MNVIFKSEKKLSNVPNHNKTLGLHEKQGWLHRFLNWLNRGTQKELRQQGSCFG